MARNTLAALYGRYASASLFVVEHEPGLVLESPAQWQNLFAEVREWWGDVIDEEEEQDLATSLGSAIFFGRIPSAATYFCLVMDGELAGQVAMFSGPGLEFAPIAESFEHFLGALPARAIHWIGPDVRYDHADLGGQHYPIAYVALGLDVAPRKVARVSLESGNSQKIARFEYEKTLDNGAEIDAPSGNRYRIVVEFYDDDEASISIDDENALYVFVRGFGSMRMQARLRDTDVANVSVSGD